MKNTIEKQKSALRVIGILALVFGLVAVIGGAFLTVFGVINLVNNNVGAGVVMVILGPISLIIGVPLFIWGIYGTFTASAIKATRGSIADGNIAKENGTVNGKKCPKCGATNTPNASECQVCHTPLE